MGNEGGKGSNEGWVMAYTNVGGYISGKLEICGYLKKEKPEIMCIVKTKLSEDIEVMEVNQQNYNVWRRDRTGKKGSGVMMMVRKDMEVQGVERDEGMAEVLKMKISMGKGEEYTMAVAYVPKERKDLRKAFDKVPHM